MVPQRTHITAKRRWYYYRRRLPRPHRGEIAVALRTVNYREARYLATVLDRAFQNFLGSSIPMVNLQDVLRDYLTQALDDDLSHHQSTPYGRPVYTVLRDEHQDPIDADSECIDYLLSDAREALARRDIRSVARKVDRLMAEHGLPPELRVPLVWDLAGRHPGTGDCAGTSPSGPADPIPLADSSRSEERAASSTGGPSLSALLPDFLDLMVREDGWRGQTLAQNSTTYRLFIEHCGDRRPDGYTRQDLASFYDLLRRLPVNYSRSPEWRGLTSREIVERSKDRLSLG